ncbi:MAG: pyridoxamine 5'-phosphate oxidase family protein, partial [Ramlibacter sp.]
MNTAARTGADTVASRLLALLRGPAEDAAAMRELLAPTVRFEALGRMLAGADIVAAELVQGPTGELARKLDWAEPRVVDGAVRLTGRSRPGTRDRPLVITLALADGRVALVQQQRMPAPPVPAQPLVLPEALKRMVDSALVERHPMLLSFIGPDDQPILSYRGSVQADGDDRLAMWIRNPDGLLVRSIARRPKVALVYRNEDTKATYHFQGRARVSDAADDRKRVFDRAAVAEREHDFAMLGVVVLVDLDRVEGYAGLGPGG